MHAVLTPPKKRVLIILYAGDYYDAYNRMVNGLGEAYRHHNYALYEISDFAKQPEVEEIAVLGCATKTIFDHELDLGFRVIGAGLDPYQESEKILHLISNYKPTHIVLRVPARSILKWAIQNNVKVITLLADSFFDNSLKDWIRHYRLAKTLNHPMIEWVGNHHINSCLSLKKIGVSANKIVPWDWPSEETLPLRVEPKSLPIDRSFYSFVYVGAIAESKGVGDLIAALAILRNKGMDVTLKIAGKADQAAPFINQSRALKINDFVEFLGMVPNDQVITLMRSSDIVFVPSHHSYPEGLPMTINEALASRTPIIASDHPMFLSNIEDGFSAVIFPEKNPVAIAQSVERLLNDPDLYFQLSKNAEVALERMKIPVVWGELIERWLDDTAENRQWIQRHTLASEIYQSRLQATPKKFQKRSQG